MLRSQAPPFIVEEKSGISSLTFSGDKILYRRCPQIKRSGKTKFCVLSWHKALRWDDTDQPAGLGTNLPLPVPALVPGGPPGLLGEVPSSGLGGRAHGAWASLPVGCVMRHPGHCGQCGSLSSAAAAQWPAAPRASVFLKRFY